MTPQRRRPTPWEAAQLPPPRGWFRRAWMSTRIRWAAATTRPTNSRPYAGDRGNERPYGASNG